MAPNCFVYAEVPLRNYPLLNNLARCLSLRFNGHFPGGPGLASTRMSPFWISMKQDDWGGGDNWSYNTCKAPAKLSPSTNQHPLFTAQMLFLSPNQQCQSTEGKDLARCRCHISDKSLHNWCAYMMSFIWADQLQKLTTQLEDSQDLVLTLQREFDAHSSAVSPSFSFCRYVVGVSFVRVELHCR